jgi:hypothetical protein
MTITDLATCTVQTFRCSGFYLSISRVSESKCDVHLSSLWFIVGLARFIKPVFAKPVHVNLRLSLRNALPTCHPFRRKLLQANP